MDYPAAVNFLCLMSSAGLANVRDKTQDHTNDSVLLEYQTALMIRNHLAEMDIALARNYINPVFVGHCPSSSVLTKFSDFNVMLYPDSVGPELDFTNPTPSTNTTTRETMVEIEKTRLSLLASEQATLQEQALKAVELEFAQMKVETEQGNVVATQEGRGIATNESIASHAIPVCVQTEKLSTPSLRQTVLALSSTSTTSSSSSSSLREEVAAASPSLRELVASSSSSSSAAAAEVIPSFTPAITSKGTPCKKCEQLGRFCHQHEL